MEQAQLAFFDFVERERVSKRYSPILTVTKNAKGVLDVDTVKGCELGMTAYPDGGCYGECYAFKCAERFRFDFSVSVSRRFLDREHMATVLRELNEHKVSWYRIGTSGDPSHDWKNTITVCKALRHSMKTPVITTKYWKVLSDEQLSELRKLGAVIQTSVSGMDTEKEIEHRVGQYLRAEEHGLQSWLRVVTCQFGGTAWGNACREKQAYLLSLKNVIDNPFRASLNNQRVISGDIILTKREDCVGGKYVSLNLTSAYLGTCEGCVEQCGVDSHGMLIPQLDEQLRMEGIR
jgi:hypothetical protein